MMKRGLVVLSADELANVAGGADPGYNPADNGLGRVGPGLKWKWLGNYYTPEALAHDTQVRQNLIGDRIAMILDGHSFAC